MERAEKPRFTVLLRTPTELQLPAELERLEAMARWANVNILAELG